MKKIITVVICITLFALSTGCGREVTRTDPDTVVDLTGWWNSTDAQLVADSLIPQCLEGRWLSDFTGNVGRGERPPTPVVVVGAIFNETSEHINTDIFMDKIEQALIESGEIQMAAGGTGRGEVRGERLDQQIFASPATAAEFGREIGADYIMTGNISSIVDEYDGDRTVYYQISLELIEVETALKDWMGSMEIKKLIDL